uniref:Major facilitator superfamily (MFS) profile domain-containing protein n=1 Tax=Bionectria ochroleuca TaxID=29856 RepID=A0A8H7TWL1_BIOOC
MATTTVLELSELSEHYNAPVRTTSKTLRGGYTTSPKASGNATPPRQIEAATIVLTGQPEFSLPPTDRGKSAWLFLAASFLIEAVVWGFPFSFGVFQDYYQTHEPFAGSSGIATIGTCAIGVSYMGFPLVVLLQRLYPRATRYGPIAGLLVMSLSLVASSFATTVPQLIVTQGIFYAIAACTCYCPCMLYLDEWFVSRRGLAFGIVWSGTGTGGFLIPLLLEFLLGKYGFRTALRIWAVTLLIVTMPLIYFVRPRLPISSSTHAKPYKLPFLFDKTFLFYQFASMAESIGFFLPAVYLPTYARSFLGAGHFLAALTVMLINVSAVIGTIVMGSLTDKFGISTCLIISTMGATLATFLLWGLASNLATLYAFCILYGLFASSYVSIWPAMTRDIISSAMSADESPAGENRAASYDPIMILGVMTAGRGLSNVVSGPLSEALIKNLPWKDEAASAWGSGYGPLIVFTGVTAVLGGTTVVCKRLGWMDRY